VQIGAMKVDPANVDWSTAGDNPFWCPDPIAAKAWEDYLDSIRKNGSSVGAILEGPQP